jgi:hypothetical protein
MNQPARTRAIDLLGSILAPVADQANLTPELLGDLVDALVDAVHERPTPHAQAVDRLRAADAEPRD